MLRHLRLRDIVLIEEAELDFDSGFNVLSGETGAGKSILLDALGLAIGNRADAQLVRAGALRAEVSAEFEISAAVDHWLSEHELSGDAGTLWLRRVVEADGRSRAFVNGHPVPAALLRELGEQVLAIHGQHAHQSLLRSNAQRAMLDDFAGNDEQVQQVANAWRLWQSAEATLGNARAAGDQIQRERDQLAWQIEELGLGLMHAAQTLPAKSRKNPDGVTKLERALLYRDGIAIVTLIRRPFRIKNFAAITIGRHLFLDEGSGALTFGAKETKGKKSLEAPLTPHLVDGLRHYIETYRPVLLTTSGKAKHIQTDALWISRDGTELAERSLHNVFRRRTKEAFGKPIPPHWFRDIDVTTLVRHNPEDARITGSILGHTDPEIANRHYNHALHIDAAKRHSAALAEWMDEPPDTATQGPL